jgi:hypothetical protein
MLTVAFSKDVLSLAECATGAFCVGIVVESYSGFTRSRDGLFVSVKWRRIESAYVVGLVLDHKELLGARYTRNESDSGIMDS